MRPASTRPPSLRAGSRLIDWRASPLIMGVVNVTPDSFSDGGLFLDPDLAVRHALGLIENGADLLDIGGESSRPGAEPVSAQEEMQRVLPVLEQLRSRTDVPISIDTTKAIVARHALDLGVDLVNDISGLCFDPEMPSLLADSQCGVVLMHMQGQPRTMQEAPYYEDVVETVAAWLQHRLADLARSGIDSERVVLDPGIGFGKRFQDNLALLRRLDRLRAGDRPLLVGASRKSFLGWLLDEPVPDQRTEGDLAIAAHCRATAVEIVRVHDVRATRRFFEVLDAVDEIPDAVPDA